MADTDYYWKYVVENLKAYFKEVQKEIEAKNTTKLKELEDRIYKLENK